MTKLAGEQRTKKSANRRRGWRLLAVVAATAALATQSPTAGAIEYDGTESASADYVAATYRGLVGREPTAEEVTAGVALIDDEGRVAFARQMVDSDVWLGRFVDDLYVQALGRAPEDAGRGYWTKRLREGASTVDVASFVFSSEEFQNRSGGTDSGLVSALYERVLEREGGAAGLAYWENQLAERGVGAVARAFYQSKENRERRVGLLYDQLLCRQGDSGGTTYWADRMMTNSDHVLSLFILGSQEFSDNAEAEDCMGWPTGGVDLSDFDDVVDIAEFGGLVHFDASAQQAILSVGGYDTELGVDRGQVLIVSTIDGSVVQQWGAEDRITWVSDVSRDGRYVMLLTTDAALHQGPEVTNHREFGQLVLVDRTDATMTTVDVGDLKRFGAEMSDDASIVWLSAQGDLIDDDVDTSLTTNVFRLDRATSTLEQITNFTTFRYATVADTNADGSSVLIASPVEDIFDPASTQTSSLTVYDYESESSARVPFDFDQWGASGHLDADGGRVLGIDLSGQPTENFVFGFGDEDGFGDSEVEVLGVNQGRSAADMTDDGQGIVWVADLDAASAPTPGTRIGVRKPGAPDRFYTVPGDVSNLQIGADLATVVLTYSAPGTSTDRLATLDIG